MSEAKFTPGPWRPIDEYDRPDRVQVDLWMAWGASPLTMGMSDAFLVPASWRDGGEWWHIHNGKPTRLNGDYVRAWAPLGEGDEKGPVYSEDAIRDAAPDLYAALADLVSRCDGAEGVRTDGSNIDTLRAHVALRKASGEGA